MNDLQDSGRRRDFFPVIVGTDLNAYYMARCFNDEYGVKPLLLGKAPMSFTSESAILELEIIGDLWDEQLFVSALIATAERLKSRLTGPQGDCPALLLVATNDFYVRLVIENRDELIRHYAFNYTTPEVLEAVQIKSNFYELCRKHGLDIPQTCVHDCSTTADAPEFAHYPVILKPANGDMYYRHKFEGQKKVYRLHSYEQMQASIAAIKASGYTDKLILQEFIEGDDSYLYDCVIYVGSDHETRAVSFAQVLLQEHVPTAIGNLTSLTARFDEGFMEKLRRFAEETGFVGFGNFDIKFDERDGRYKVLELNVRQGRSSYYMTAQGRNMARLLVDDVILGLPRDPEAPVLLDTEVLFAVVPLAIVRHYARRDGLRAEIRRLKREGRFVNPLINPREHSLKRRVWQWLRSLNYFKKYLLNKW
jgi:D-aspartate ligase